MEMAKIEMNVFGESRGMLVFRAVILLLLGILLVAKPLLTAASLTLVIGVFLMIEAFFALWSAFADRRGKRWLGILYAVLTLLAGLLCFLLPLAMDFAWVIVLGCWQLVAGFNYFVLAFRRAAPSVAMAVVNGVLSLFVGVIFIIAPFAGLLAAVWILGALLILAAIILLVGAFEKPSRIAAESPAQ